MSTSALSDATACVSPVAWWNIRRRMMPDYNRKAAVYWWTVVSLGSFILGLSIFRLTGAPADVWLRIGICTGMAMLAGLVPVGVPGSNNSFTAGEIFIFLLLLLSGVEAAAVACACEAFVGSFRTSKRLTSWIASPAMAALALYSSGSIWHWSQTELLDRGLSGGALLLVESIFFSLAYFVINTVLVTMVPRLKRNESIALRSFFGSFGWLGLAYSANAVVASFLYLSYRQIGITAVIAAAPVIAILLTTGHYFFRRKEADEAVRLAQASEAEHARQHVRDLEASERRFHSAFTDASIGMALVTFSGQVRQINAALIDLFDWNGAVPAHVDFNQFVSEDGATTLANLVASFAASTEKSFASELKSKQRDGSDLWMAVNGSLFSEPVSAEPCLILQVQDITDRKRAQTDLHHIAFHDSLTGLPNRHRFNDYLELAIRRNRDDATETYGVLFLDFDRFKLINDSLGHTVGDQFLIQVARRIQESLRKGDLVARLGGDEFAILMQHKSATTAIVELAERLQQTLRRPFAIGGTELAVTASMGITGSSIGYSLPEEVLRDADIAMYKAKAAGKARYAMFDVSLHQVVANRLRLEGDLRRALESDGMSVDYQPLYDLRTERLIGFEALARWHHPELGSISPASFIPVAEESNSIVQLTDFVLTSACRRLKAWQQVAPQFENLKMHVNIAGNDIAGKNFVARIARTVMTSRLEPGHLSIELTENILMEGLESAIGKLNELQELGVGMSVDDFGTGYSSLSHLSSLPIHSLKIDRSFVRNLVPGSKESAVIRAIVLLGSSLGKEVIAEGIETVEQLEALADLGCDVGQGYFLGRPMSAESVDELLQLELDKMDSRMTMRPRLMLAR